MKKWLKVFGLSFFSDKITKETVKYGFSNFALGFLLALIFLFCGVLAADVLPFKTHYKNSTDFTAFVRNAIAGGGAEIEVSGGKIFSPQIIDSFKDGDLSVNGYNLVVDTRPADALDDFEAYYLSNDGKAQEITPEEFSQLSDVAKRNFDFKIRYTSDELVLTDELTAAHESYLAGIGNESFAELKKKQGEMAEEEYRRQVYGLYVKAYYPDLSAYESTGSPPLLRNYYFHTYLNNGAEKYLFIFDDSCAGAFETDGGLKVSFYGFYSGLSDGKIAATEAAADDFVLSSFAATTSLSAYVYLMNIIRLLPFIILMPLVLALIVYCVLRLMKAEWSKGFGGSVKIVGSYLAFGALIAALITFICGYFVPRGSLIIAAAVTFFLVLLIRSAVLLVGEWIKEKKKPAEEADEIETEV